MIWNVKPTINNIFREGAGCSHQTLCTGKPLNPLSLLDKPTDVKKTVANIYEPSLRLRLRNQWHR
jgi:hypothetical protein